MVVLVEKDIVVLRGIEALMENDIANVIWGADSDTASTTGSTAATAVDSC
jgi:hypothetical protein